MGGNAFDNLRRLEAEAYRAYELNALQHLRQLYPQQRVQALRYYRNKPSFGDLDIVIEKTKVSREDFEAFLQQIGADDVFYNNDMISFRWQDFQVDLIYVPPECFDSACFYFADNDLNNLVGRVAHKFGLKFGWDGLTYQIRTESGHKPQKIVLSRDPAEIYAFLGYDYARWQQGFDELPEIFEFVASTPFFHPEIFHLDRQNHQNRTRNRKRSTYQAFLSWLESEAERLPHFVFQEDKSLYLIKIHNAFPRAALLNELLHYAQDLAAHEARGRKFNGHRVAAWTGLKGKALGLCISRYKRQYEDFQDYLNRTDAERVKADFADWWSQQ